MRVDPGLAQPHHPGVGGDKGRGALVRQKRMLLDRHDHAGIGIRLVLPVGGAAHGRDASGRADLRRYGAGP